MERKRFLTVLVFLLVLTLTAPARAQKRAAVADAGPFFGVDLGVSEPINSNYRAHVHTGGSVEPYVGYMLNKYLGLQGGLDYSFQPPDDDDRSRLQAGLDNEENWTHLLGLTVGPRFQLPVGDLVKLYVNGQGGMYKGLHGRLNQWAPGVTAGGGLDVNLTPNISVGVFGRWHLAYMSPHPYMLVGQVADQQGPADIQWVTAGIALQWAFAQPAAPPPPPAPVAQAPPPAPPAKKKIVLRSVHFDFDKATLKPEAKPILDEAVQVLKQEGSVDIVVEGHTDSIGTEQYNLRLSRRRADTVRRYLVDHGIAASRITAEGFGESKPVASNDTADGRAQNRRVELHVR